MNQPAGTESIGNMFQAKLNAIDEGLCEFVFGNNNESEEGIEEELNNSFYWPENKLPKEIEPGDEVLIEINLKNREEKIKQIKKRREDEMKNAEMRKMLEELVN